jgi:5-formyltetrahydrofolate cyclo-ligase
VPKQALRQQLRRLRSSLSRATRRRCARRVAAGLLRWRTLRRARNVAVYLAVGSELSTAPLIAALRRHTTCRIWVPAVGRGGVMRFVPLPGGGRLRPDHSGMPVPVRRRIRCSARRMRVVIMPLLGFDRHGHRLGGGRGCYDRALAGRRGRRPWLVGLAFAAQEVAVAPADPWDVDLDAVVTESGMRRLPRSPGPQ